MFFQLIVKIANVNGPLPKKNQSKALIFTHGKDASESA